jgi:hypothetical protein
MVEYPENDFDSSYYTVLNDSYKEKMLNRKEYFWFVGCIKG